MSLAGPDTRVRRRQSVSTVLFTALVALASFAVACHGRPAGADQISDLRARATTVAEQLVQQELEVGAYQQQYSVISSRVGADAQAVSATDQQIAADQQQIAAKTNAVRQQAIRSYLNYGNGDTTPETTLFSGSQERVQAASEYSSIAVGNITDAVDQLHAAESALQAHEAVLRQQQGQDQSDQSRQVAVLGQANDTADHLNSLHAEITGQLATAVASQQAAQAQAAATAVAAADRASATGAAAPTTGAGAGSSLPGAGVASPTPVAGTGSSGDPALNPFLQCVVQAESGGNYGAVSPDGLYMGAFQFSQATWNTAAQAAGRPDLVGVPPNLASKADQDTVAVALYALDGQQPWLGDRCSS
jgi:peptidoglycan hydrolase CwlO-like protein